MALLSRLGRGALAAALAAVIAGAGCAGSGPSPEDGEVGADRSAETDRARRSAVDRLVARGLALLEDEEPGRAAAELERAVRVDPSHGRAYLALARARMALGEEARARGLLERARELLRARDDPAAARADSLLARLEEGGG